jgi:hypothetical protein
MKDQTPISVNHLERASLNIDHSEKTFGSDVEKTETYFMYRILGRKAAAFGMGAGWGGGGEASV